MKNRAATLALMAAFGGAQAQTVPVVGVWEKNPVTAPDGRLVARTNYIFTNVALKQETVFTAIQNDSPLTLICCIKVTNLKPLVLKDILEKYRVDPDFVSHLKSIQGAPFMYESAPVDRKEWNRLMRAIASGDSDPNDQVPYNAPVVAARLGDADEKRGQLESGPAKVKLRIAYPKGKNKAIYTFRVDNKDIVLSEDSFPEE